MIYSKTKKSKLLQKDMTRLFYNMKLITAEYMQGTGVPYEEGKKWNINMIARILSDERYITAAINAVFAAQHIGHAVCRKCRTLTGVVFIDGSK